MLKISKHCQERYAERIMSRDSPQTINVYIAQNEDKINERINKMHEYGEKIFEGRTKEDGNFVNIYFSDPWVLIVDRREEVAITLYKVEAVKEEDCTDKELNELFIKSRIAKIKRLREDLNKANEEQEEETVGFREEISANKTDIKDYEDKIQVLKKRNDALQECIDYGGSNISKIQDAMRNTVEELVGVKILRK